MCKSDQLRNYLPIMIKMEILQQIILTIHRIKSQLIQKYKKRTLIVQHLIHLIVRSNQMRIREQIF